jgi:hypothetical protein
MPETSKDSRKICLLELLKRSAFCGTDFWLLEVKFRPFDQGSISAAILLELITYCPRHNMLQGTHTTITPLQNITAGRYPNSLQPFNTGLGAQYGHLILQFLPTKVPCIFAEEFSVTLSVIPLCYGQYLEFRFHHDLRANKSLAFKKLTISAPNKTKYTS